MKFKLAALALISILVLFAVVSCAGSPPVAEAAASEGSTQGRQETTQATMPQTPSPVGPLPHELTALNAAAARAEAARKMAGDFDGASLFPEEWLAAESLYGQAEEQRRTGSGAEVRESAVRYETAADAFEALNALLISHYYENAERELNSARRTAVMTGAQVYTPGFLLEADSAVAEALEKYKNRDYYAAREGSEQALHMYNVLNTGLSANKVRLEIEERGFGGYDPSSLNLAEDNLADAISDFSSGNYAAARNKAEDALLYYETAMKTAWEAFAGEKAASALAMRQRALELKANVAVSQGFDAAETIFSMANTGYRRQNFEESAQLYVECELMYTIAAEMAIEKQRLAEEAMRRASQRTAESEQTAMDAELIVEGRGE